MAKKFKVYKCEVCGNVVQVVDGQAGTLVCCGQDMVELEEKTADSSTEKHVPVITKTADGYEVVVGSTLHPMEEKHYIEYIELQLDMLVLRQYLKPGDEPKAKFAYNGPEPKELWAREYCNLHGLWKGSL